jgi:hypothetical protein
MAMHDVSISALGPLRVRHRLLASARRGAALKFGPAGYADTNVYIRVDKLVTYQLICMSSILHFEVFFH